MPRPPSDRRPGRCVVGPRADPGMRELPRQDGAMTTRWQQAVAVRPTGSSGRWAADVAPGLLDRRQDERGLPVGPRRTGGGARSRGGGRTPPGPTLGDGHVRLARAGRPGRARTQTLRAGRGSSALAVSVEADGQVCLHASVTCGALPPSSAVPVHDQVRRPVMPPAEDCVRLPSSGLGYPVATSWTSWWRPRTPRRSPGRLESLLAQGRSEPGCRSSTNRNGTRCHS